MTTPRTTSNTPVFFLFCVALLFLAPNLHSQETQERPTWIPQGLLFQPLRANVLEPRVGGMVSVAPSSERPALRLDIGNSIDIVSFRSGTASSLLSPEVRLGAEFFTFTRLRSEVNFRFPVETTDFYFGVNASAKTPINDKTSLAARLRVAHISAHLVDGFPQFQQSFVYSREFVDAVLAVSWALPFGAVRVYGGATVLFHSIPDNFGSAIPQLGADATIPIPGIDFISICAGYDLKASTIFGATGIVQSAQAGVKFGEKFGHGVLVSAYWYDGKSPHGMFYNQRDSYIGIGFQVE